LFIVQLFYFEEHNASKMKQVVPKRIDPTKRIVDTYFPGVFFVKPQKYNDSLTSSPIYFAISFRHSNDMLNIL